MLYLLLIGRIKERKKKKRNDWGAFFPLGLDTFCLLCCSGFSWMLVVIKG
jgi:hypothetical protein